MVELIFSELTKIINDIFASDFLPAALKWLAIGGMLLFTELIHRAWMIIWFAVGAAAAALVAAFFPAAVAAQVAVFFGITGFSLGIFIYIRHLEEKSRPPVPILPEGRKVRVIEEINGLGAGVVSIDGVSYKARLENSDGPAKPGEWVITAGFHADELTVIVKREESLARR